MPIPRIVHFLTAAVVIVLLAILGWQNFVASKGDSSLGYLSFNRAAPKEAQTIMDFWRKEDKRVGAVRTIIITDYVLIVVYVVYLTWCLSARRNNETRKFLKGLLTLGMLLIVVGALLDVWQDRTIWSFVSAPPGEPVDSLASLTRIKWMALMLGVLPLPISYVTRHRIDLVSGFLQTVWTYFPSLLFIFLTIFCFWIEGQGKDILTAFTEGAGFNLRLILFFLAIGLWIYVSWYSSRVIFHIRESRGHVPGEFLEYYPRFAGNACFLVLELAVLQSPLLEPSLPSWLAWVIFGLGSIAFPFLDRWVRAVLPTDTKLLSRRFWIVFAAFFGILLITAAFPFSREWYTLLALLLIFHVVYFFYINLHHQDMKARAIAPKPAIARNLFHRVRQYFQVPQEESGYLKWYLVISAVAVILDIVAVCNLDFSRLIGPFPLLLMAFGVLLAFGNLVTAFSVKYQLNFHLVLFLMALVFGVRESHQVRITHLEKDVNGYAGRPTLKKYLDSWLSRVDTTNDFNVYLVLANGGASRSGYWTASVLGRLEDASMQNPDPNARFSHHLLCLSGTSGGGVGVATFFALLDDKEPDTNRRSYERSAKNFLQQDYFTYTVARMLGPDYFRYILPVTGIDRGAALEKGFENYTDTAGGYGPHFEKPFSHFKAMTGDSVSLPVLFVNTTRMQDGNPGLVTNLQLEPKWFSTRIDVPRILADEDSSQDISMASGAILGARFPYLSPAGKIGKDYFVDGGYFDNSGAGSVQELLRGILNIYDSDKTSINYKRLHRLHFKVLHILNSPVIADTTDFRPVPPIKNDLLSPVATIIGAYDMQTTVNDGRLKNFLDDIRASGIPADYIQLSLYKDAREWAKDSLFSSEKKEPAYSMNWFISEKTRGRMDRRLVDTCSAVDSLVKTFKNHR